jgi:hypothetical protein
MAIKNKIMQLIVRIPFLLTNLLLLTLYFGFVKCKSTTTNISYLTNHNKVTLTNDSVFNMLSYDTMKNNKHQIPLRFMSLSEINERLPYKRILNGESMIRNGTHYEGKRNNLKIVTSYPGVFLYLDEIHLNRPVKIEWYDQSNKLISELKTEIINPYINSKLKNVLSGKFDFESMSYNSHINSINFKSESFKFIERSNAFLQYNTNFMPFVFEVIGLDGNNSILGFESTIKLVNNKGKEIFSRIHPFKIDNLMLSANNRFLIYGSNKAQYMPNANKETVEIFIEDLQDNKLLILNINGYCLEGLGETINTNIYYFLLSTYNINRNLPEHRILGVFNIDELPNYTYVNLTKPFNYSLKDVKEYVINNPNKLISQFKYNSK